MAKDVIYGIEARNKLMAGIDQLANAVKATIGPKGRNVVLDKKFGAPLIPTTVLPSQRRSSFPILSKIWVHSSSVR